MGFEIKTFKEEYENLKRQIEEYQDFWEWYECKYDKTKADLFDEYDSERGAGANTGGTFKCVGKTTHNGHE